MQYLEFGMGVQVPFFRRDTKRSILDKIQTVTRKMQYHFL